jgi:RND superfamily putative drug exporter
VFVVLLSYLVLLVVLRSAILPLKAVLMNALSVAAAYGVLVMVFQWGWFDSVTGYESLGYVQAITPALLLAVVFGLSMDYEVFMLSRIKERYHATGDTQKSVAEGLAASAKTISSAALIMVAVFAIFAGTGVPQVKEIGVGLAVAIALDATIVRLVLVPTTMQLMGDFNWWIPEWLDRLLPDMDFESSEPAPTKTEEVVSTA